jgi:AAA15 family ATPase/GTPase
MDMFIRHSVAGYEGSSLRWVKSFRLLDEEKPTPSSFEMVILLEKTIFRYGFEVTGKKVISEWLYRQEKRKEEQLFLRNEEGKVNFSEAVFAEGKGLEEKTRNNALFLTVAAQFNGPIAKKILDWYLKNFYVLSALEDDDYRVQTKRRAMKNESFRTLVSRFLNAADFGIDGISVTTVDSPSDISWPPEFPANVIKNFNEDRSIRVHTVHPKFDSKNEVVGAVEFDLFEDESEGTKRFFCMLGPIFRALSTGGVLVVDELDSSLHSRLVWRIAKLFNSVNTNPKNAQLIFTTHDTTLLNQDIFRRDQMWFTEKNHVGVTSLYSLADYDLPVRNDASFERDYLRGKYGAIPSISSEFDQILSDYFSAKEG